MASCRANPCTRCLGLLGHVEPRAWHDPHGILPCAVALPDINALQVSCNEYAPWVPGIRTYGNDTVRYTCSNIVAPIGTGPYRITGKLLRGPTGDRLLPAAQFATECNNWGGRFASCV